jgi:hypothetical protein
MNSIPRGLPPITEIPADWQESRATLSPSTGEGAQPLPAAPPRTAVKRPGHSISKALLAKTVDRFFLGMHRTDALLAEDEAKALIPKLIEISERYAVAKIEGKVIVLDMYSITPPAVDSLDTAVVAASMPRCFPVAMEFDAFKKLYLDKLATIQSGKAQVRKNIGEVWLEWPGRTIYDRGLVFAPGVRQDELSEGWLNLFTGWNTPPDRGPRAFPPTPYTEEDRQTDRDGCSKFLDHILWVNCQGDKGLRDWVLWWMADILQNPMERPGSAIVLQGKKGAGKSIVADVLCEIIGQKHFVRVSKKEELVGTFTGHLAGALIVNCEEASFGGDAATNNTLKHMITGQSQRVNEKFLPSFEMRPHARYIFTTNEAYSHNTDESERRFLFLDCSDEHVGNLKYFEELMAQMEWCGGYAALASFLFNMQKPDGVNLRQPPKTEGHTRLMLESLSVEERFFANALIDGENYPDDAMDEDACVFVADVKERFVTFLDENGRGKSLKKSDPQFVTQMMVKYWSVDTDTKAKKRRNGRVGKQEITYTVLALDSARTGATETPQNGGLGFPRHLLGLPDEM